MWHLFSYLMEFFTHLLFVALSYTGVTYHFDLYRMAILGKVVEIEICSFLAKCNVLVYLGIRTINLFQARMVKNPCFNL